ncbi:hypothetical protein CLONEX_03799 [[Clostridium] nexile DSM 1787]|nr:hypothetical protein CLONEX_03799 [[Clostridium] nexile DSM 1787]
MKELLRDSVADQEQTAMKYIDCKPITPLKKFKLFNRMCLPVNAKIVII